MYIDFLMDQYCIQQIVMFMHCDNGPSNLWNVIVDCHVNALWKWTIMLYEFIVMLMHYCS